jgi:hypothetical protein
MDLSIKRGALSLTLHPTLTNHNRVRKLLFSNLKLKSPNKKNSVITEKIFVGTLQKKSLDNI